MATAIDHNTPEITVLGQTGQALRQLRYCRTELDGDAEERISQTIFNPLGQMTASADARLFAAGATPNFRCQFALNGQVLRTDSVDAGVNHTLYDIEGRPIWRQDARGALQRYTYDALGRLVTRYETTESLGAAAIRERLIYGEDPSVIDAANKNLRGQLARHYDTAGCVDQSNQGYTLNGGSVEQTRRLLPIDTDSDWQGEGAAVWQVPLETEKYTTRWTYDAQERVLQQTDAKGHVQDMAYDVQGRLKQSGVTPVGGTRQAVLVSHSYNAAGQTLCQVAGNGVATDYIYEAQTQRLLEMISHRSDDSILQHWVYAYDPVGNLTAISDNNQAIAYFRNRKVNADKTYGYDSLYQLIHATGRENATVSPAPVDIDNPTVAVPIDQNHCTPYTRRYTYDAGDNLTQIQHQGDQNYTRTLAIFADSNRISHIQRTNAAPSAFTPSYDACGNPLQLDTGPTLTWDGLNQLRQVTVIARSAGANDGERYQYDSDGARIRKVRSAVTGGATQTQAVIYLPGLELRRTDNGNPTKPTEDLEVITLSAVGHGQVRLLHWLTGRPADIPNQQLRYSLDDHLGSSQLELDQDAQVLTLEDYYPYGGTAARAAQSETQVNYKIIRYSGKERDSSGLYYYGHRYYPPWLGRWLNTDPAGAIGGLNLYRMVKNNPIIFIDADGLAPTNCFSFLTKKHQPAIAYAPAHQQEKYVYFPIMHEDRIYRLFLANASRKQSGKQKYIPVFLDKAQKSDFDNLISSPTLISKIQQSYPTKTVAKIKKSLNKQKNMGISNLTGLKSNDILYINSHGAPGSAFFYPDDHKNQSNKSAADVADELVNTLGLPESVEVRVSACNSAVGTRKKIAIPDSYTYPPDYKSIIPYINDPNHRGNFSLSLAGVLEQELIKTQPNRKAGSISGYLGVTTFPTNTENKYASASNQMVAHHASALFYNVSATALAQLAARRNLPKPPYTFSIRKSDLRRSSATP